MRYQDGATSCGRASTFRCHAVRRGPTNYIALHGEPLPVVPESELVKDVRKMKGSAGKNFEKRMFC